MATPEEKDFLYHQKVENDLQERIKELECLYSIGSELESGHNLKTMLENATSHLVKAFQYPDIAVAVISLDGTEYGGSSWPEAEISGSLTADIEANGKIRGKILVGYRKQAEFLLEEQKMIKEIGRMISKAIERDGLQKELKKYVGNLEELVKAKTRELEKSKKRYEDLFEYAPDGIVITKLNGDIVKANRTFYRMLHYPEDGSIKLNFVKNKLYDDIPHVRPFIFRKLKTQGYVEGVEMTLIDARGAPCPVIGSFIRMEIDGVHCIEAIYKDIRFRKELEQKLIEQNENLEKTVQKRTEDLENQKNLLIQNNQELLYLAEKLKESKNKLQTLFNAITDTVVMIDADYNVKMANQHDSAFEGKCYARVFKRKEPCENCPTSQVFSQKKAVTIERKIGDDYYELQAYPILNEQSDVEGILEFSRRITHQKNIAMQLVQTDKLAALGQLVSGIAHEINNPNTFLRGNISIIQEAMKDVMPVLDRQFQKDKELRIARLKYSVFKENIPILIDDMAQGSERIKSIVDGLRKFAKRDDGILDVDVDMNAIVESCLRLAANQIGRKARVKLNLTPGLPRFNGNSQRLEQVVVNILINASQAMDKKKGLISIATSFREAEREVVLKISDNGKGMEEKTMNQIFDPFFTTKRHQGGTGLGLSIAYGIIKDHKGRIEVESEVGTGTTFFIVIPLPREEKS